MRKFMIAQIAYPTKEDFTNGNYDAIKTFCRGYVDVEDNKGIDHVWHLCNWACWSNEKPECVHSSIGVANSDIIVWEDGESKCFVAESVGWKEFATFEEARKHMMESKQMRAWPLRKF